MTSNTTLPKLIRFYTFFLSLLLLLGGFQSAFAQAQLTNLSTRAQLQGTFPSDVADAGFIITGTGNPSKKVCLRALGVSLAIPPPMTPLFTFAQVLSNPLLTLNFCATCPLMNNDWYSPGTAATAYANSLTAVLPMLPAPPPPSNTESAIIEFLPTGAYTARINTTGNGTVEVYDVGP